MWITILLACDGTEPKVEDSSEPVDTGPQDADGDGVYTPDDCLDDNANAYPGAEDHPGDNVDADCDGLDGIPIEGCSPIDVPDVYASIDEAVQNGDVNICLGPGEFTMAGVEEEDRLAGLKGQGRGLTIVHDPAASDEVSTLDRLTVTGVAITGGGGNWYDVTAENASITGIDNFACTRCGLVNSPIELAVHETYGGISLVDSWLTQGDPAIHVVSTGCQTREACSGLYMDVRAFNTTFSHNTRVYDLDLSGEYNLYLVADNSIFVGNTTSVLEVDLERGEVTPGLGADGSKNTAWDNGADPWPDGYEIKNDEEDPELDFAFGPPRPLEGSSVIGATNSEATTTDYWGLPRDDDPDRGAVEW